MPHVDVFVNPLCCRFALMSMVEVAAEEASLLAQMIVVPHVLIGDEDTNSLGPGERAH